MDQKRDAHGRFVATKPNYQVLYEQEHKDRLDLLHQIQVVRRREQCLLGATNLLVRWRYQRKINNGDFER